jgi:RES domain
MTEALPPLTLVRQYDTHRLIPSHYSLPQGASVLTLLADDDAMLADLFDLDNASNDRLLAENELLPGIGLSELVFGVPHFRIVNAAYCHPHPLGSRFNGPDRGAWYAGFALQTAVAEVVFHKTLHLQEVGVLEDSVTYDDYLADFSADFHDLRQAPAFADCLSPDSYVASQALAERLLGADSLGIVYPSTRDPDGTCLACFRPALVGNVRKDATWRFTWSGSETPVVASEA